MCRGDNLVTNDKPTGESVSSPMVCKRYKNTIKIAGIIPALADPPPTLRARNPIPKSTKPNPNL